MAQFTICIERTDVFEGVVEAETLEEALELAADDVAENNGNGEAGTMRFIRCDENRAYEVAPR